MNGFCRLVAQKFDIGEIYSLRTLDFEDLVLRNNYQSDYHEDVDKNCLKDCLRNLRLLGAH